MKVALAFKKALSPSHPDTVTYAHAYDTHTHTHTTHKTHTQIARM